MKRRIVVVGLDGVPPELLFEKLLPDLPTIKHLTSRGIFGTLRSCDPPITVPAWAVMTTGRSPEELGVFGFRERIGTSYTDISLVSSQSIKLPGIWDYLGQAGRRSCLFGVPPGYPAKSINGALVGCHLTPDHTSPYTNPPELKKELESSAGAYIPDVNFRIEDRARVLNDLIEMTDQHAKMQRHLFSKERWDFFMSVEIGTDRVHHAFWKFSDPHHPLHTEDVVFSKAISEYYKLIDGQLHELLSMIDDDTLLMILSDHGAKAMQGAFCLNEWLIKEGYLVLKKSPSHIVRLEEANVDWARTIAWGWGGYYARLFLNVKGREAQGCVAPHEKDKVREKLLRDLNAVQTPDGEPLGITVINPANTDGATDLMLYFGDLSWRSAGTIGHGKIFLDRNDTGPDDAVHSKSGVFLLYDPKHTWGTRLDNGLDLIDVAPTILNLMDIPRVDGLKGKALDLY